MQGNPRLAVPTKARSAAASCFTAQLSLPYDTSEVLSDENQPERTPLPVTRLVCGKLQVIMDGHRAP